MSLFLMKKSPDLPDDGNWIFATGPLTSPALGEAIQAETGAERLAFFDAIAPIVYAGQHRHVAGVDAVRGMTRVKPRKSAPLTSIAR